MALEAANIEFFKKLLSTNCNFTPHVHSTGTAFIYVISDKLLTTDGFHSQLLKFLTELRLKNTFHNIKLARVDKQGTYFKKFKTLPR